MTENSSSNVAPACAPRPNETAGLYRVRWREPDPAKDDGEVRTLWVEAPSLAVILDHFGGHFRDGGAIVWGGKVLPGSSNAEREPDLVIVPVVA